MARTRVIIVISVIAAAAWLLPGAVRAVLIWFGPPPGAGPGPVAPLIPLVPETVPVWAWHSVAPWAIMLPLVSTVAMAALVAVAVVIALGRMPSAAPRWRVAVTVWAIAVAAGIVLFGAQAVASLVDDAPFLRLQYVADRGVSAAGQGLIWSVLWGWIPGVVASRIATPGSTRPGSPRSLLAAAIVLGVVATSAVVLTRPVATDANYVATGQHGTNGVQPAPTQPAVIPASTPPPLIAPGAGPADPAWCTSAQLDFSDGGGDAATGHRAGAILAQNIGDGPCVLSGYPDLAFADDLGDAVAVTVTPGGGFMTEDPGPAAFELAPGDTAVTYAAWDATDGRTSLNTIYVAPYAGAERVIITVAHPWDLTHATVLTVTAWQTSEIDPSASGEP